MRAFPSRCFPAKLWDFFIDNLNSPWAGAQPAAAGAQVELQLGMVCAGARGSAVPRVNILLFLGGAAVPVLQDCGELSVRRDLCSSQGSQDLLFGRCGTYSLKYREILGFCFVQQESEPRF